MNFIDEISTKSKAILNNLKSLTELNVYIDDSLEIPRPFKGLGEIKLVVLGQDPTVKKVRSRSNIKCVLNLDREGSIRRYLTQICGGLNLDLNRNIYATNLVKNFFIDPPTKIKNIDALNVFKEYWLPLLEYEINQFPNVPIISLGQPLLKEIVNPSQYPFVRYYWDHADFTKSKKDKGFTYLDMNENCLNRIIFPFPHQPSINKNFYRSHFVNYLKFMRKVIGDFK